MNYDSRQGLEGFPPGHPALYVADDEPDLTPDAEDEPPDPVTQREPPTARALGLSLGSLPPQRARLARFAAWHAQAVAELAALETARTRYLETMGVPVVTEEKLRALVERDTLGLLALIKGGAAITRDKARAFEREKLEQQIAGDRHEAETVRGAMNALESEIDATRRKVEALAARHRDFVIAAITEHADGLAAEYLRCVAAARAALVPLMGAAAMIPGRLGRRLVNDEIRLSMPRFDLPCLADDLRLGAGTPDGHIRVPRIVVTEADTKAAAAPWRALMDTWLADPLADAPATMGAE